MTYNAWLAGDKITAARLNAMVGVPIPYTPAVTNGGSATFSAKTGLYAMMGPFTWVNIDITIGTAGSGAGLVMVSMPTSPDRGQRQVITMHTETIGANGNAVNHFGGGEAVFLAGGSGATTDRLRTDEGGSLARENNILGADLLAGGHITIQGFYL